MCSMDCTRQACQSRFKISKPSAPIQREQPQQDFDTGKRLVGCLRKINRPGFPARDPAPIPACPDAMPDAPCRTSTAARMWTPLSCDARFASVTRSCPRFLEAKRRKACRTALSPLGQKLQQNMPWHGSGRSCLTSPVVAQPLPENFKGFRGRLGRRLLWCTLGSMLALGPGPASAAPTDPCGTAGLPSPSCQNQVQGAVSFNGLETMTLFMPCTNAPSTRAVPTRSNPPGSRASRPDQPRSVSSFWLMHRQIPSKAHREKLNLAPMVPGAVSASPAIHVIASTSGCQVKPRATTPAPRRRRSVPHRRSDRGEDSRRAGRGRGTGSVSTPPAPRRGPIAGAAARGRPGTTTSPCPGHRRGRGPPAGEAVVTC